MNKPKPEEIIEFTKALNLRKPIKIIQSSSIESFTLVYTYKVDAKDACDRINRKYGSWVYAMVHDMWRNPHVSIGYRSKELES